MSELSFLNNIADNNDLNKILEKAGDSIVTEIQDLFKQDPSKVLDVFKQMKPDTQNLPNGFPSIDQLLAPVEGILGGGTGIEGLGGIASLAEEILPAAALLL